MRTAPSCIENCGAEICPLYDAMITPLVQQNPELAINYRQVSVQAQEVVVWLKRVCESRDALPMSDLERTRQAESPNPGATLLCALKIQDGECAKYRAKRNPDGIVELLPKLRLVD